jgi:hypothetical protein
MPIRRSITQELATAIRGTLEDCEGSLRTKWSHLLLAKKYQIETCLYARLDFIDFDGLINHEVGNESVRRSERERLRRTRALWQSTSELKEKGLEQMCPLVRA